MSCLKFFFPSWWHVGIFHTCAKKSPWTVARSSTDTLSTLIAPWLLIVNKVNCRCFCLCEKHVTSSFNKIQRCLIGLRCGFICPLDGGFVSLEANSHIRINLFSNWIHWITDKVFIDLQWHLYLRKEKVNPSQYPPQHNKVSESTQDRGQGLRCFL